MSDAEVFTNEATPGIRTQVAVMRSKTALFVRDDMEGEEPSVIMLDHQTALKVAKWIMKNVEVAEDEPLYRALVKWHEFVEDEGDLTCNYWKFDTYDGDVFPSNLFTKYGRYLTEMSKSEWNRLGINDSNADFVKVGE